MKSVSVFRRESLIKQSSMILKASNIIKYYGKRPVVNNISLDVRKGEIVGLLGPNGAGKTTCFYMMVGLVKPFKGNILLNNLDITKLPMYKRAQLVLDI